MIGKYNFKNTKSIINSLKFSLCLINKVSKVYIPIVYMSGILSSIFQIIVTYSIGLIVNSLESKNITYFIYQCGILLIITIFVIIINSILVYYIIPVIDLKINRNIKSMLYKINYNIDYSKFETMKYKDKYFFSLENYEQIKIMHNNFSTIISSALSFFGILLIVISIEFKILIIILLGSVFSALFKIRMEKEQFNKVLKEVSLNRELKYIDITMYSEEFSKEIRVLNITKLLEKMDRVFNKLSLNIKTWSKTFCTIDILSNLLSKGILIIVIIILGVQCISGQLNLGEFIMLITAAQQISFSIQALLQCLPNIISSSLIVSDIRNFVLDNINNDMINEITEISEIQFNNVEFYYDKSIKIFDCLNIKIKKDDRKVLIKGKNGIGKTTLLMLISGVILPKRGEVRINGIASSMISKRCLVDQIDIIFQDFKFFSGTIFDNIVKNKDSCNILELDKALDMVGMKKKIYNLPLGLNTVLFNEGKESGINFSKGELQRLALARAICSNSKLVLIDEGFSFCDNELKQKKQELIDYISNKKRVILVSHDKLDEEKFDKVIILK